METVLKDCFWCGQSYSMEVAACPNCATRTNAMNGKAIAPADVEVVDSQDSGQGE